MKLQTLPFFVPLPLGLGLRSATDLPVSRRFDRYIQKAVLARVAFGSECTWTLR
jgi:hypothetical protein